MVLYGDVSMTIRNKVSSDTLPQCLEDYRDIRKNQSYKCTNVQTYNDTVMCAYERDDGYCKIRFETSCDVILGPREAIYECDKKDASRNQRVFIPYPNGVFDDYFINMVSLDLSTNFITKFNAGHFQGLSELKELDLRYNMLRSLPGQLFQDLFELEKLDLSGNEINELNALWFQGLIKLKVLDLIYNMLRFLQGHVLQDQFELEKLDLSVNEINELNAQCFEGLLKLKVLNLYWNMLTFLPGQIFQDLFELEALYLSDNQISELNAQCFQNLIELKLLDLSYNMLRFLPGHVFQDQFELETLNLRNNQIGELYSDFLRGLSKLKVLSLGSNLLKFLPGKIFQGLVELETLELNENQLSELSAQWFQGLSKLKELNLGNNMFKFLPGQILQDQFELQTLFLNGNQISELNAQSFEGLNKLKVLNLEYNKLKFLPGQIFQGLYELETLYFSTNQMSELNAEWFLGLSELKLLHLYDNMFSYLPGQIFQDLFELITLDLKNNQISGLNVQCFQSLRKLKSLYLSSNILSFLPGQVFQNLFQLETLYLNENQISELNAACFLGLSNLTWLDISDNKLRVLSEGIFQGLFKLDRLELYDNQITKLNAGCFQGLSKLTLLDITLNPLTMVTHSSFSSLPSNVKLSVDAHEVCVCLLPTHAITCTSEAPRSPYLTCERLLADKTLAVCTWIIAFNAFSGNLFVLIWRSREARKNKVNSLLLSNLAVSDFLMGIYMFIIGSADIYFGDYFPMQAETWRTGITCRIAGALSIISSEASVFFVMLISIDRFICIRFPYSNRKLTQKSVAMLAILTWTVSLVLGIVPSAIAGKYLKFYDNSHVCIGLPLALAFTGELKWISLYSLEWVSYKVVGHFYSTALFLGVNSACYLVVLVCYIEIVRAVGKSATRAGRSPDMDQQLKLTKKATAIVATDFFCWAPIIILGILVQTRVITLPASVFAWCVTVVLPINSAINPYLYTIHDIISKYRREKCKKLSTDKVKMRVKGKHESGQTAEPQIK